MTFLRIFKHLLPRARAWRITVDKTLRRFFSGLTGLGDDSKKFIDDVWLDIFPETTRQIEEFESQFALTDPSTLTEQERRDRLSAAWQALGGQDPRYIQDTLRDNGFDVYVHEWWVTGSEPAVGVDACAVARNPNDVINNPDYMWTMGNPLATMGNTPVTMGGANQLAGYLLVNGVKIACYDTPNTMGNPPVTLGSNRTMGQVNSVTFKNREYDIPTDPDKWPYILYIGGQNFGDVAQIPIARRDEFETLCLKICPEQQWLGIIVEYV